MIGWMVVVAEVDLFVGEQVMLVDFFVDKVLVVEGIVVGMAENIVTDNVGNMVKQMVVDIAGVVVEEKNILSILVVGMFVAVGSTSFAMAWEHSNNFEQACYNSLNLDFDTNLEVLVAMVF